MRRALMLLPAMVLTATACGSAVSQDGLASLETGPPQSQVVSGDPEIDAEESILAFTECLRTEGVPIADPEFDDGGNLRLSSMMDMGGAFEGFDPDDLRDAFDACSQHLAGVAQLFTNLDRTVFEDRLLVYAACMRENGFDMPDPDFDGAAPDPESFEGDGTMMGPFGAFDIDDPAFVAANDVCLGVFGETLGPDGFGPGGSEGGG